MHVCIHTHKHVCTCLWWYGDKSHSQSLAARADGCLYNSVQIFEALQKDALATCFIWTASCVALELLCTQHNAIAAKSFPGCSCHVMGWQSCQPFQSGLIKSQWQGPESQDQPGGEQGGVRRALLPYHWPPHSLVQQVLHSGKMLPWQIPLVENTVLHPEHGLTHGENAILLWGACWGLFDFSTPEVP